MLLVYTVKVITRHSGVSVFSQEDT